MIPITIISASKHHPSIPLKPPSFSTLPAKATGKIFKSTSGLRRDSKSFWVPPMLVFFPSKHRSGLTSRKIRHQILNRQPHPQPHQLNHPTLPQRIFFQFPLHRYRYSYLRDFLKIKLNTPDDIRRARHQPKINLGQLHYFQSLLPFLRFLRRPSR